LLKVKLKFSNGIENVLALAEPSPMNMSEAEQTYRLTAGCKEAIGKVRIKQAKSAATILYLNKTIFKALSLPEGITLYLKYANGKIILGPLLGIFLADDSLEKLPASKWGSFNLPLTGKHIYQQGLVYFFSLDNINWDAKTVHGYYWSNENHWVYRLFPLPEVIYDRCLGRGSEQKSYALRSKIAQKALTVTVFNQPVTIGKLAAFQCLSEFPEFKDHLPAFSAYSKDNLHNLLEKHGSVYLMPDERFSKGTIYRITKKNHQEYLVEFNSGTKTPKILCKNFHDLSKKIKTLVLPSISYVLQSKVNLATFLGNMFSVQVILQKTTPATWEATGLAAKLAFSDSITASSQNDGKLLGIKEVLSLSFPSREEELIEQVKAFSKQLGSKVADNFGRLVELEIDLGIDPSGKLWLAGLNSKPTKSSFSKMGDKVTANIINLAPMLSGFIMAGFNPAIDRKFQPNYPRTKFSPPTVCHQQSIARLAASSPTVGMTVQSSTWKNIAKKYAVTKRALLAIEKGVFFYCFRLNKADWHNDLADAYYFDSQSNKWVNKLLPLPHVLYDREYKPKQRHYKYGTHHSIQWVNTSRTFGKWELYQALAFFKDTCNNQPETALLTPAKLRQFLKQYQYCYIKNNYGRLGKKVMQVEKAKGKYICRAGGKKAKYWEFSDLRTLCSFLRQKLGKNLILQQGISLARMNNCPFDLRVLAQKNINACWTISAVSLRIAQPGAIVTNVSAGAKEVVVAPGDEFPFFGLSWEKLEEFSLQALYAMEASFGRLGEVGLDVALDHNGKLWFIEANSRPSSSGYREKTTEEVCKQIFGLPLDYAKYLANYLRNHLEP
jgi:glutathione synthase/RimK-type ligase-like ATP-grasp enzyme